GTVSFTSSDPQALLPADYTFTAADHGTHSFSVTLKTAWMQTITVTDTAAPDVSTSQDITVSPAAGSTLRFDTFASFAVTTGNSPQFSVNAYDAYGNAVGDYAGTVHFTSSDGQAVLPADYTFTPGHGTGYLYVTLRTVGTQSLTVTDQANPGIA